MVVGWSSDLARRPHSESGCMVKAAAPGKKVSHVGSGRPLARPIQDWFGGVPPPLATTDSPDILKTRAYMKKE